MGPEQTAPRPAGTRRLTLIAIVVALVGSLAAAVVLFAGAAGEGDGGGLRAAEGVVTEVGDSRLTMRLYNPIDGREQLDLAIEPEGASEKLDLEHLTFHAASGNPMRIWFERRGDDYVARDAIDLPGFP